MSDQDQIGAAIGDVGGIGALLEALGSDAPEDRETALTSLAALAETSRRALRKSGRQGTGADHVAYTAARETLQEIRAGLKRAAAARLAEPPDQPPASRFRRADARARWLVLTGATLQRFATWWDGDPYAWLHRVIPDSPEPPDRDRMRSSDYEDERIDYVRSMQEHQRRYLDEHGEALFLLCGVSDSTGEGITATEIRGPLSEEEVVERVRGLRWECEGPVPESVVEAAERSLPFRLASLFDRLREPDPS